MKRETQNQIFMFTALTITFFIILLIGALYIYIRGSIDAGHIYKIQDENTSDERYALTSLSDGEKEIVVTYDLLSQASVGYDPLISRESNLRVTLVPSKGVKKTQCTYDIALVWNSKDVYEAPSVVLPYNPEGTNLLYPFEFSVSIDNVLEQKDISTFRNKENNKIIIYENALITADLYNPQGQTANYLIRTSLYNLPVEQPRLLDKTFAYEFSIENISCKEDK